MMQIFKAYPLIALLMTNGNKEDSIDIIYKELYHQMPVDLKKYADFLPYFLGISDKFDGTWNKFINLDVNQNLPKYILNNTNKLVLHAHHIGGLFGIVLDRLVDEQGIKNQITLGFKYYTLREWIKSLNCVIYDRKLIRNTIAKTICIYRKGIQYEKSLIKKRKATFEEYTRMTFWKLYWIEITTRLILIQTKEKSFLESFEISYFLFLCSCQCMDDLSDCEEDKKRFGLSYIELLGSTKEDFFLIAIYLLESAYEYAKRSSLNKLAQWIYDHKKKYDNLWPLSLTIKNKLTCLIQAKIIEETIHSIVKGGEIGLQQRN